MKTKIKVFIDEQAKVMSDVLAFINVGHVFPISIGSEILNDGRLFMTISYNESPDAVTYELQTVVAGSIADGEESIATEIENSIPAGDIVCHEMIVDNEGTVSIIYLLALYA